MKKTILFTLILAAFFAGCNSKRQYYEPEDTDGKAPFTGLLKSSIEQTTIWGATLKDGSIITKDGLVSSVKLDEDFKFLAKSGDLIVSGDLDGDLKIQKNGEEIYSKRFKSAVVAASINGNLLAGIDALNNIFLINFAQNKELMQYQSSDKIYGVDSRIAAPIFLDTIIVYPSLDGKIYVVQKNGNIIRDFIVSAKDFFNNIIFLDLIDNNNMVAATAKKALSISTSGTKEYEGEIKDILRHGKELFIFKKDGNIIKTDLNFKTLSEAYFKFAIFSKSIVVKDKLYIFEKNGYLIKTDLDLQNPQVYKLDDELDYKSFLSNEAFYYDDEFMKFE